MRSRPVLFVILGLIIGAVSIALTFWIQDDFARSQVPWMLAVMPMFVVGAILVIKVPESTIGWLLFSIALFAALGNVPGLVDVPGIRWFGPVGAAFSTAAIALLALLLVLFPDGVIATPLSRWAARTAIAAAMVGAAAALVVGGWGGEPSEALVKSPLYESTKPLGELLNILFFLLFIASLFGAVLTLVQRFRNGSAEVRLQVKWLLVAAAFMASTLIPVVATAGATASLSGWQAGLLAFGMAGLPIAILFAVLRYRLYDIDVVISRTFVFGSLAVFIGAVYVAVVVGVGALVGSADEPNAALAIAATAIVAVAFQPLRRRLERVANRLVYGRRATPYEVLSEFSRRVAATDEALLDEAARSLVDGTGAEHSAVWVNVGDHLVKAAEWPEFNGGTSVEQHSFPIVQDSAELGVLTLGTPRGQRLPEEDHRLAIEVASGMGLALRNQLLTESLQARVEELRDSRKRLVAVQDETRRKLERDLHDGAQQQLVALKVKLGLARAIAEKDGATDTAAMLQALAGDADEAVDAMRDFARGVYPPLLEAEGLGSAIAAQARRAPLPVAVESDGIGRYSREVEATVYFCVLEALQNVAKYSEASHATVTFAHNDGSLGFTVVDNGAGFDPVTTARGAGLTNMEDRLDAAGGVLAIESNPAGGTSVGGSIPVLALEGAAS